jgi:Na+/H+ antiporter NhaD/arsenite permease-like protein
VSLFAMHAALFGAAGPTLDLPLWSVTPFALLLLAIALLPLLAEHWWHENKSKALVVAIVAIPTALYLFLVNTPEQPTLAALSHEMLKYVYFILLLGSLYIVAGGIVIAGDVAATPLTNTAFLALGCVLANFIGTTGASVLLIRPVLRINQTRQHTGHLPIFFIFTVSNLGGLLTPLGDPPLFLGFLNGVSFFWTLSLWREWLLVNGIVLAIFFIWDTLALRRDGERRGVSPPVTESLAPSPLRLQGSLNLFFLAGIIGGVLAQGMLPDPWGELIGGITMAVMAILSWLLTPRPLRSANGFTWGPILEDAILFIGIFVTMVPALEILAANRDAFNISQPWQYFWLTGGLSAFLDNAPTYLTFATMAAGSSDFHQLMKSQPLILQAISCGAVFMGALTYIGNGPNFMVKAIAEQVGYKMPTFFGYLCYACLILGPVLVLVTFLFFRP